MMVEIIVENCGIKKDDYLCAMLLSILQSARYIAQSHTWSQAIHCAISETKFSFNSTILKQNNLLHFLSPHVV